jgi:hypothetical protein
MGREDVEHGHVFELPVDPHGREEIPQEAGEAMLRRRTTGPLDFDFGIGIGIAGDDGAFVGNARRRLFALLPLSSFDFESCHYFYVINLCGQATLSCRQSKVPY